MPNFYKNNPFTKTFKKTIWIEIYEIPSVHCKNLDGELDRF